MAEPKIEVTYGHPEPRDDEEREILTQVDLLDAKLRVAVLEKNEEEQANIRGQLEAFYAAWDAKRAPEKVQAPPRKTR